MYEDSFDLKQLVTDNPDAEVLVMVSEDSISGDYFSEYVEVKGAMMDYLTDLNGQLVNKDELEERIRNHYAGDEFLNLNKEEYEKMCQDELNKYIFSKYIIILL